VCQVLRGGAIAGRTRSHKGVWGLGAALDLVGAGSARDGRAAVSGLALVRERAAFELHDALTVVLDGLSGQHAALVILELTV